MLIVDCVCVHVCVFITASWLGGNTFCPSCRTPQYKALRNGCVKQDGVCVCVLVHYCEDRFEFYTMGVSVFF